VHYRAHNSKQLQSVKISVLLGFVHKYLIPAFARIRIHNSSRAGHITQKKITKDENPCIK
jgi:hypothetical protein